MKLKNLIDGLEVVSVSGNTEREISDLSFDSREIEKGSMFIAISGTGMDGHDYIEQAIAKGAHCIVCEHFKGKEEQDICVIIVSDSRFALAYLASEWYGNPSRELSLVGITGTNGKTTIATLLYKVNTGLGYKAGILTTIEVIINGKSYPATHTTPDPLQINKWLRKMVDEGCQYCFMEVSSHAISQQRVRKLDFNGAVFTNLTQDHLDYHKDFRDYLETKQSFFTQLSSNAFALSNANDKNGAVMLQLSKAQKHMYGLGKMVDYRGKILEQHFEGMHLEINDHELWVRLAGRFNALNILAVYGVCMELGHSEEEVLEVLSDAGPAEGRFDVFRSVEGRVAIVDYAHTEDALQNVLETIHEITRDAQSIITVVGAGGDRDKGKRPAMGKAAAALSQRVILTSDNPRSEEPSAIVKQMEEGIPIEMIGNVLKILDREEAIKTACMLAGAGDVILVAGKGHEKYQQIGSEKHPFDDKEIIMKYLK